MSGFYQERYAPLVITGAGTTIVGNSDKNAVGGFLCITAGTLTVQRHDGSIVVNALPCAAGIYYPMPFYIGYNFVVIAGTGLTGVLGLS